MRNCESCNPIHGIRRIQNVRIDVLSLPNRKRSLLRSEIACNISLRYPPRNARLHKGSFPNGRIAEDDNNLARRNSWQTKEVNGDGVRASRVCLIRSMGIISDVLVARKT